MSQGTHNVVVFVNVVVVVVVVFVNVVVVVVVVFADVVVVVVVVVVFADVVVVIVVKNVGANFVYVYDIYATVVLSIEHQMSKLIESQYPIMYYSSIVK